MKTAKILGAFVYISMEHTDGEDFTAPVKLADVRELTGFGDELSPRVYELKNKDLLVKVDRGTYRANVDSLKYLMEHGENFESIKKAFEKTKPKPTDKLIKGSLTSKA